MPRKLQLALQGGGAKLFAIMACMEELEARVRDSRLEIERIAGTSAGALVGGLYAAGIPMHRIHDMLANTDVAQLMRVTSLPSQILWVALSWPLAREERVRERLEWCLGDKKDMTLNQVTIPLLIIASDVGKRRRIIYDSTAKEAAGLSLVKCILDSCGLPFFFRTAAHEIMDGGLSENLPTQVLVERPGNFVGDVVGVSFLNAERGHPNNARDLALAILDTALSAAEDRARSLSNVSLLELRPFKIATFDFSAAQGILAAVTPGKSGHNGDYDANRELTKNFLDNFERADLVSGSLDGRMWEVTDDEVMHRLWDTFNAQHLKRLFHYDRSAFGVDCRSLSRKPRQHQTDAVVQEVVFRPTSDLPLDCLRVAIAGVGNQKPKFVSCLIEQMDGGESPTPVQVPAKARGKVDELGLLLFFPKPLEVSEKKWYRLRAEYSVECAFPPLRVSEEADEGKFARGKKGVDQLGTNATRNLEPVGMVELVLRYPAGTDLKFSHGSDVLKENSLDAARKRAEELFRSPSAEGSLSRVWRSLKVARGDLVNVEISL